MNTLASPTAGSAASARRGKIRIGFLGGFAVGLVLSGGLHWQTAELTGSEVLIGGGIAALGLWGGFNLLVTDRRPTQPVRWAIRYGLWCLTNLIVALAAGISVNLWLRFAFPALVFPAFFLVGWGHFRSPEARAGLLLALSVTAAVVVLVSLYPVRSMTLGDIEDLQSVRRLGGDYFSVLATTLTLPLLVTAAGRRVFPWPASAFILSVGVLGLALTFTRTYWLSTAASTGLLLVLVAGTRREDFRRVMIALPLVVVALTAVFLATVPGNLIAFGVELLSDLVNISGVGSLRERLQESTAVLAKARENPLTLIVGNGFAARYAYEWVNPVTGVVEGGLELQYVHNYFVYVLFTSGALGLLLFLAIWYSVFRTVGARVNHQDPVRVVMRLAVLTASVNLLISSLAAPRFMDYEWSAAFGLLLGAAID